MAAGNCWKLAGAFVALAVVTGCEDSSSPNESEQVAVRFASSATTGNGTAVQNGSLVLTGTNGTLRIDSMFMIVDEFELKRVDDDDCPEVDDDSCEEFEAGPLFLDVPLDGEGVIAVRQPVPPGTYRRLEFEIEDLDDDDEGDRAALIAQLRTSIRTRFPNWPENASVLVIGTFTPTSGAAIAFRSYFDAEIEIDKQLQPAVVIDGSVDGGTFTVRFDPTAMFRLGNGTVLNLAAFDFVATGQVPEFELEMENGFTHIEFDRD